MEIIALLFPCFCFLRNLIDISAAHLAWQLGLLPVNRIFPKIDLADKLSSVDISFLKYFLQFSLLLLLGMQSKESSGISLCILFHLFLQHWLLSLVRVHLLYCVAIFDYLCLRFAAVYILPRVLQIIFIKFYSVFQLLFIVIQDYRHLIDSISPFCSDISL